MQSITANKTTGMQATAMWIDDVFPSKPLTRDDFVIHQIGRRDYVFALNGRSMKRYQNSSKHAAERHFIKWLQIYNITCRLTS